MVSEIQTNLFKLRYRDNHGKGIVMARLEKIGEAAAAGLFTDTHEPEMEAMGAIAEPE